MISWAKHGQGLNIVRRGMEKQRHLVLAGAGHAHMVTLQNIAVLVHRGHDVTVIGPADRHYYSGMGPGMLGGSYNAEQISFNCRHTVERQGGNFIRDSVVSIDPYNRMLQLSSGAQLYFDVLSCNLGSTTEQSFSSGDACPVYTVKPIENLIVARKYISSKGKDRSLRIAIIGGGPSAAELSGNIMQLAEHEDLKLPQVIIHCRSGFMERFSSRVQQGCASYLGLQGITIREHDPVETVENGKITTRNGNVTAADVVFAAQGIRPSSVFRSSSFKTGPDGGLPVNGFLQSIAHPQIFGGGDCVFFCPQPLDKVGVYAVRQNPVLFHNLLAALEDRPLQEFSPGGGYLLIFNLGKRYGVLQKGSLFWQGRIAFMIKDLIDKRFMRRFK